MEDDFSNSVSRALSILECFSPERPHLTASEIQKLTDVPRSTVFRLLATLTGLNYLKQDGESRKYFLGSRVLSLGFTVLQNQEGRDIARPYLQKLSREFNRSVNLLMPDKDEMVFIERIRVPGLTDLNIGIGGRIPMYNTGAGRAILAHLNPERFRKVVELMKKNHRVAQYIGEDGETLKGCLEEVRRLGYALNDRESDKSIRAVAVPIFSSEGVSYAAHIVATPEEISVDEFKRVYALRLIEVGREISEALGYRSTDRAEENWH